MASTVDFFVTLFEEGPGISIDPNSLLGMRTGPW